MKLPPAITVPDGFDVPEMFKFDAVVVEPEKTAPRALLIVIPAYISGNPDGGDAGVNVAELIIATRVLPLYIELITLLDPKLSFIVSTFKLQLAKL
jgi:hypothetical protein